MTSEYEEIRVMSDEIRQALAFINSHTELQKDKINTLKDTSLQQKAGLVNSLPGIINDKINVLQITKQELPQLKPEKFLLTKIKKPKVKI